MTTQRKCFLVCPIGPEDSDIRRTANDLLDVVISPALQMYDFEIIRADKIPRPSLITSDIIQLVQTADLCIIDLTESNPNVFYECGRRHETGRPFIQLIRKGERLPFDLSGIRTIQYDLSSARSAHEAVIEIQRYVGEMIREGLQATTSGESLGTIATSLERIQRQLASLQRLTDLPSEPAGSGITGDPFLRKIRLKANPERAFLDAWANEDLATARAAVPTIYATLGRVGKVVEYASTFARAGDDEMGKIIKEIIDHPDEELDGELLSEAVACLYACVELRDAEATILPTLNTILEAAEERDDITPEDLAMILNQRQKVLHTLKQYEKSLKDAERIVQLCPKDCAYWYNLSSVARDLGMKERAASAINQAIMLMPEENEDYDYYRVAVECFTAAERTEEARKAFQSLKRLRPTVAELLVEELGEQARLLGEDAE